MKTSVLRARRSQVTLCLLAIGWFATAFQVLNDWPSLWGWPWIKAAIISGGLVVIGGLGIFVERNRAKIAFRQIHGLCPRCGYDLRACPSLYS